MLTDRCIASRFFAFSISLHLIDLHPSYIKRKNPSCPSCLQRGDLQQHLDKSRNEVVPFALHPAHHHQQIIHLLHASHSCLTRPPPPPPRPPVPLGLRACPLERASYAVIPPPNRLPVISSVSRLSPMSVCAVRRLLRLFIDLWLPQRI